MKIDSNVYSVKSVRAALSDSDGIIAEASDVFSHQVPRSKDVMYAAVAHLLGYAEPAFSLIPKDPKLPALLVTSKTVNLQNHVMKMVKRENEFHVACKKSGCLKRIRVLVLGEGNKAGVRTNTFSNINFGPFSKHIAKQHHKKSGKPETTLDTFFNNAVMVNAAVQSTKGQSGGSSSGSGTGKKRGAHAAKESEDQEDGDEEKERSSSGGKKKKKKKAATSSSDSGSDEDDE